MNLLDRCSLEEAPAVSGIYCIADCEGTEYVGSAVNIRKRAKLHEWMLRSRRHSNFRLQQAADNGSSLTFSVIELCHNSILKERERHHITIRRSLVVGFNLMPAAGGRNEMPESTKEKMRAKWTEERRHKQRLRQLGSKASAEAKQNMRASHLGKKFTEDERAKRRKWKHSEEAKAAIAAAGIGRKLSVETRKKIAIAHTGMRASEETRLKIGIASKGRIRSAAQIESARGKMIGRKISDQTREKLRASAIAQWVRQKSIALKGK